MPRKEPVKPKIIHRMADGTIRDSIEGLEIPYNTQTVSLYRMVAQYADKIDSENAKDLTYEQGEDDN